jgi:hypothetical protein
MYSFGASDGTPIIGDWNGDGKDQIGVRHGSIFYLDYDGDGAWDPAVRQDGQLWPGYRYDLNRRLEWRR